MWEQNEIRGRMLFITWGCADSEPWACGALCGSKIRVANVEQATCLLLRPFRNSREFDRARYDCGYFSPLYKPYARTAALRRIGRPHEIANVAGGVFDRFGSFVTGVDLEVDGGLALCNCMPHSPIDRGLLKGRGRRPKEEPGSRSYRGHVRRQQTTPGGRLVRTIGIVRARAKIGLQNLVYNIHRPVTLQRMASA